MKPPILVALLCLSGALARPAVALQEAPLNVDDERVKAPKRIKLVRPEYPAEARAQGIRGIVILTLTIDPEGRVSDVEVVRSIPGLDEAAVTAARQWLYEPPRLDGKPVSVRLSVPITFALELPAVTRQPGIPELRVGAAPAYPRGAENRGGTAVAEVTLDPQGRVVQAEMLSGESPWVESLLQALRTWTFVPGTSGTVVSFRVEAEFQPAGRGGTPHVALNLTGLRQSESMAAGSSEAPAASAGGGTAEPSQPATAPAESTPPPEAASPESAPAPAPGEEPAHTPAAGEPTPAAGAAPPPQPAPQASEQGSAAPPAAAASPEPPSQPAPSAAEPPPTPGQPAAAQAASIQTPASEVLTAPAPAPTPVPPAPEALAAGISSVRDVSLGTGIPDLASGRRPVVPPLARMQGLSGVVVVRFSIDGAGDASVQAVDGPELLQRAAREVVASWHFRRTSLERVLAVAEIEYLGDKASASLRRAE